MATRLQNIDIDELSGVASPANQIHGWLIQKSEDGADREELLKMVDEAEADIHILHTSLESTSRYFETGPESVRKAHAELLQYAEDLMDDDEEREAREATHKGARGFLSRLLGREEYNDDQEETVKNDETFIEDEGTDEELIDEPIEDEEDGPDQDAIVKGIVEAVSEEIEKSTAPLREALAASLDRIEQLEGRSTQLPVEDDKEPTAKSDDGASALHSAFRQALANPGSVVTLS